MSDNAKQIPGAAGAAEPAESAGATEGAGATGAAEPAEGAGATSAAGAAEPVESAGAAEPAESAGVTEDASATGGAESAEDASAAGAAESAAAGRGRAPDANAHRAQRSRASKDVLWYSLARLALFLAVFFVLVGIIVLFEIQIPLAILAVLALIVAMPASVFLFPSLRTRANEGVAVWDTNRRAHKEYVREQLAERETW